MRITKSFTLFLTGLPGAGKTTLGNALYARLTELGLNVELLDSDTIDARFVKHIAPTPEGRDLRVRMMAYAALLLNRHHTIAIVIATSPVKSTRDELRTVLQNFLEVFVCCSVETAARRDPKGLYALARRGVITDFTGIDSAYEPPIAPEIFVDTERESIRESVEVIYQYLITHGHVTL